MFRQGTSRVRSGCVTCKYDSKNSQLLLADNAIRTRHLKCDEGHPNCERCVRGRRKCVYGTDEKKQRWATDELRIIRYVAFVPDYPSSQPSVDPQEARSLQFFRLRTAPEMGGPFSSEAWSSMTRQAHYEKATLHAVVALSSLHEHYEKLDQLSGHALEFSMQQYGKAIREVVRLDVAKSAEASSVALRTCLLFAFFESLQGHYTSALMHLNSGLKLLHTLFTRGERPRASPCAFQSMTCLFRTIKTQILEIGDRGEQCTDSERFLETPIRVLTGFFTLEEAMTSLEIIRNAHLKCFDYSTQVVNSTDKKRDLMTKRVEELTEAVENWSTDFESLLNTSPDLKRSAFAGDNPALLLIQIHRATLTITLSFSFVPYENPIDTFGPEFRAITRAAARFIDLSHPSPHGVPQIGSKVERTSSPRRKDTSFDADSLLSTGSGLLTCATLSKSLSSFPPSEDGINCTIDSEEDAPSEGLDTNRISEMPSHDFTPIIKPTFSVGLGIIYPLFIVCAHCRDAQTRHQALHLLKICNRKEGIWDSLLTARVAEMAIDVEEQETLRHFQRSGRPFNPLITAASEVPDHARVRWLSVKFVSDTEARIKYRLGGDEVPPGLPSIQQRTHVKVMKW